MIEQKNKNQNQAYSQDVTIGGLLKGERMIEVTPKEFETAFTMISEKKRILLVTHMNPDGDAIGSSLALYGALKKMGKNVTTMCANEVPHSFQFLFGSDQMKTDFSTLDLVVKIDCSRTTVDKVSYHIDDNMLNLVVTPVEGKFSLQDIFHTHGMPNFDLIITLDTPALELLGSVYENNQEFFHQTPIINFDHHVSNHNFGALNIVETKSPSTGEVLYHFFLHNKIEIDKDMATAMLAAIVTDTGSYQHASTTWKSFSVSSELMQRGGDLQAVIDHVYRRKSVSTLKIWGKILSRVKHDEENQIVWATVTQEDFKQTGASVGEAEAALNDLLIGVPDAKIFLLIYEYPGLMTRGSIRTASDSYNASEIAEVFGGGGHPPAAGFRIENTSLEDAEKHIISSVKKIVSQEKSKANVAQTEELPGKQKPMSPEQIIDRISTIMEQKTKDTLQEASAHA